MAKRKSTKTVDPTSQVTAYQHGDATRKNNPPAGLAPEGTVPALPKTEYHYSPRRPPELLFDPTGQADKLPDLLRQATQRPLTPAEAQTLAAAMHLQPWLEWAGKREQEKLVVDPVAIQIHEHVEAEAILRVATRQDIEANLFSTPELNYTQAVEFYQHDVNWRNRLILGDSLQVMASLAKREDLAGQVQMIYIDPPYGIKYGSNFQSEVGKHLVKDQEADLTREPEMIKAFRDTWHLGIHSYLSYLRDRLLIAKQMLMDTGSVFLQISNDNLHHVKELMDEVFGCANFKAIITVKKTSGLSKGFLPITLDYLLWYTKTSKFKYNQIYLDKLKDAETDAHYSHDAEGRLVRLSDLTGPFNDVKSCMYTHMYNGSSFVSSRGRQWKTTQIGMQRLASSDRVKATATMLYYRRYAEDCPVSKVDDAWDDISGSIQSRLDPKVYVVQTSTVVVRRCMLMTTDPGDLVFDPTCGSGTTAYVAEKWGRRWITVDTSRVAVAIARQRLLTAKYNYYDIKPDPNKPADAIPSPRQGFIYKTVPRITLETITQNHSLDLVFVKYESILNAALEVCNVALCVVTRSVRESLETKLKTKVKGGGKRAVTDADRLRWMLPAAFEHWTVPFDTDPDWPAALQAAVVTYRAAWRAKMDQVNDCIAKNAKQEELVDKPEIDRKKIRVSGPFTVEGVQPPELSLSEITQEISPIGGAPEKLAGTFAPGRVVRVVQRKNEFEAENVGAYLDTMTSLLKGDGVTFPDNREMKFTRLQRCDGQQFHAEGRWVRSGESDHDPDGDANVGVVFGPQYGPFTLKMLELLIRPAGRKYEALVLAAFSFTAEVSEHAEKQPHPTLKVHLAHVRPDVNPGMNGLLKQQPRSQLFTVFGQPRTRVEPAAGGEFVVHMDGVDIFDPVQNVIRPTDSKKVAAWFLDGDYDGKTFCMTQAFFPDRGAWEKLAKALGDRVDPERFEALSGTASLPFPAGTYRRCAVKVIDPRGNEVMRIHALPGGAK